MLRHRRRSRLAPCGRDERRPNTRYGYGGRFIVDYTDLTVGPDDTFQARWTHEQPAHGAGMSSG